MPDSDGPDWVTQDNRLRGRRLRGRPPAIATTETRSDPDYQDITLQDVPRATAFRFRAAAEARGMTSSEYLARLVSLHQETRRRADEGDEEIAAILDRLRLNTISI
jgi:hypothetical protein